MILDLMGAQDVAGRLDPNKSSGDFMLDPWCIHLQIRVLENSGCTSRQAMKAQDLLGILFSCRNFLQISRRPKEVLYGRMLSLRGFSWIFRHFPVSPRALSFHLGSGPGKWVLKGRAEVSKKPLRCTPLVGACDPESRGKKKSKYKF